MKMPKGGGPVVQLAASKNPFASASDDACIYWDTFAGAAGGTVDIMAVAK